MKRTLMIHSAIAAAATLAAYVAWASPSLGTADSEDSEAVVIHGDLDDLRELKWQEEQFNVTVTRNEAARIRVTVEALKKAADPKATKAAPKTYPGSEAAKELLEKMAPLTAARSLGTPEAERLKELGFDKPGGTLTLKFEDDEHSLKIGGSTYGSGDNYLLGPEGEVFLLRSSVLSGLKRGARTLQERKAIAIDIEKIVRAKITTPLSSREVVQRFAEDNKKSFYADPAEPKEKLEQLTNWIDRVLKLRIADVVDDKPLATAELTVEFFNGKGPLGSISLWRPGEGTGLAKIEHVRLPREHQHRQSGGGPARRAGSAARGQVRHRSGILPCRVIGRPPPTPKPRRPPWCGFERSSCSSQHAPCRIAARMCPWGASASRTPNANPTFALRGSVAPAAWTTWTARRGRNAPGGSVNRRKCVAVTADRRETHATATSCRPGTRDLRATERPPGTRRCSGARPPPPATT